MSKRDKAMTSIHQIIRCTKPGVPADKAKGVAATPPVSETIPPDTAFMASAEERDDFLKLGAAKDRTVKKATAKTSKKDDSDDGAGEDLIG